MSEALEHLLLPRLVDLIGQREPGHCLRVLDLSVGLGTRLCRRLRTASATPHCYVLASEASATRVPTDVAATSTKLVELRNPDDSGAPRPVLVVFIPPGAKASAEDSFGPGTFEEIGITDAYEQLAARLADELPAALHTM